MLIETLDLSDYSDKLEGRYRRLAKTHIKLLSSQVPESFIQRFENKEDALRELLDTVYGTMELEENDP